MPNTDEIEEMVRELRAPVGENAPAVMEKAAFLILRLAAASPAQPTREEIARTMSDDKFFYSKTGFAPYSDGSGFCVTVTIEQETENSEPTVTLDDVWRLPASEWVATAHKIERLLDLIKR